MLKSYSQSGEDLVIFNKIKSGTILEVGANEGELLSNSKMLIEQGFKAHLIEPGETYHKLAELHKDNPNVYTYNFGIAKNSGFQTFYQSGSHDGSNIDSGLVSTMIPKEMNRWKSVDFKETKCDFKTFNEFWNLTGKDKFDVISIDCEGMEYDILTQINLKKVGCKMIILEWNGNKKTEAKFKAYCRRYRMREIHRNSENLIYSI